MLGLRKSANFAPFLHSREETYIIEIKGGNFVKMHEYQTEKIIEGRCPKCHAPYGVIVEMTTNTIVNEYTDCQCSAPEENLEEKEESF